MRSTWGFHPQTPNKYSTVILGLYQPPFPQVFISFGSSKEIKERKPTRGRQRCFSNGLGSLTRPRCVLRSDSPPIHSSVSAVKRRDLAAGCRLGLLGGVQGSRHGPHQSGTLGGSPSGRLTQRKTKRFAPTGTTRIRDVIR